jgi:hypothetical protein
MRRRDFIQAIVGSSIASPITAWAQQSGRTRLIGVLINGLENDPEMQASLIAFKQELERLNWSDGRNARLSYGIEQVDVFRQAASYVDRILRGTKPAELPMQAPTNYKTVVNLKTAKALGLDVPPSLLVRADEVIE